MNRPRRLLILLAGAAIPLLVSQLLPADNPDRWSPIAVVLLLVAGVLAGWAAPTVRGWMATVAWTVVGSALILLSWTDLVLDVRPSILSVETWRNEAFVAIAAALAIVSVGFVAGALVGRRGCRSRSGMRSGCRSPRRRSSPSRRPDWSPLRSLEVRSSSNRTRRS